jgi:fatty-acyl-CoA synthase
MGPLLGMGDVLRAHARIHPERLGARDLSRSMTFREWNVRSCRLANALLGLGLQKGDRVGVLAYNCVEWMEIYAAATGSHNHRMAFPWMTSSSCCRLAAWSDVQNSVILV